MNIIPSSSRKLPYNNGISPIEIKPQYILDLVLQKARAGLRAEASRGYLGMLWWIIEPVLYMAVFYVAFAHIYHRGDSNYVMFLLTGLIVWKWFQSTVNSGANSLIANINLMNQVYLPKIVFPLTNIAINTFKFCIVMSLFLLSLHFTTIKPTIMWMFLPILILSQLLLIIAVTCLLSAVMPFFPDLRFILDNLLVLLFFLSGIFFNIEKMPAKIKDYFLLNPMAALVIMYRNLVVHSIPPNWHQLYVIILSSLVILLIAFLIFNRFDRIYPKFIH